MSLKLRPTGLGSGIDKDAPITQSTVASKVWSHLSNPRRAGQSSLVVVANRHWSDDALDKVATLEEAKAQF
jgi:hypothetical protein